MKRILSIDWDYFIDATFDQRYTMFPDGGNENLPTSLRDFIWDTYYRNPELEKMKVIPDYKHLLHICKTFKGEAYVADSHKWAYEFIMPRTKFYEEFEVYNIDFHHDLYNYTTKDYEVNCGNWVTELRRDRPNMKYKWIACETSDAICEGEFVDADMCTMGDFLTKFPNVAKDFQYLFICRSATWSPPHLDNWFVSAVKALKCDSIVETSVTKPRPYEIPTEFDGFKATYCMVDELHKKS